MTFDFVPNLTTWSTFWQFDWHIENLIDILTIWLTFWQLGWHFDILFVSRQIWKDLVKSSSSKNHIFTLGHFGRHLDLTQIETAQSGRLHVYNNEEHVETLWRGRWQQWRTGGNSSIRKMTGTARWEPKAFLLQLNRVSRNLKRKSKKKVFPDISNKNVQGFDSLYAHVIFFVWPFSYTPWDPPACAMYTLVGKRNLHLK